MNRLVFALASSVSLAAFANASGAIGYSGAPSTGSCNDCHSGGTAPTVTITGPDTLAAGATGNYTVVVNGGARVGVNIAITDPLGALNPLSSNLGLAFRELYQSTPQASGTSFQFSLSAPPNSGTLTIYATGNAVNNNGATSGDRSANATKAVTIMAGTGALPPTISTPAAAMQSPLRAKSTPVTVMAADDGPQGTLTYTWSATGPGAVVFSPNSNNAAASSTATFSRAGDYMITVTVRDSVNQTVESTFALTVESTYTALKMTPYAVRLAANATQTFTTVAVDQFGAPVTPQPAITYEVPAGCGVFGTNCTTGCMSNVFKAQAGNCGPTSVVSRAGGVATSSTIAVGATMLPASGDTVPPTAALVEPASGTVLMTGVVFEAIANDPAPGSGIAKVEFTIAEIPVATATASPWRVTYTAAAGLPDGRQPLVAVAYDLAGNIGKSSSVIVDVPRMPGGGAGGGSGTGGGSGGGAAAGGGSGTGGGGGDPGGCACGTTDQSALAGMLALLGIIATRRRRVPAPR